jgi:hypothetical protein
MSDPCRPAFGLCDLGLGEPELGYVSFKELAAARGPLGLPLERDLHFAPTLTISGYTERAREHRRIVQRVFRTFVFESVAFDPVLKRLPPALRG